MKYIALVAFLAVAFVGAPQAAKAQICGEAISFNLSVAHLSGSAVTFENPAQMGEVIRYSVTVCPAMGWTDNYGNSKWGTAYFDRGIDQPTHQWRVTLADSSVQEKTVYVASSSPPPPPPPSQPYELTCCIEHGSTSSVAGTEISSSEAQAAGVVLPLNFSTGSSASNKCWRNHGPDQLDPSKKPEYRNQGLWPYFRKVTLRVYWCAVRGVKIVGSSALVDPSVSGGGRCTPNGTNKFIVQGGNGYHAVVWQGKAFFKCKVPLPWPLDYLFDDINLDQWVQGVYYDLGGHFVVKTGGS